MTACFFSNLFVFISSLHYKEYCLFLQTIKIKDMKKNYLSVFLFGLTTLTFAQKQELSVKKAKTKMEVFETIKPRPFSSNINKVDIWTSDFSNAADWVTGTNATGNGANDNWVIGTAGPAGSFAIAPIASTTAANGFI